MKLPTTDQIAAWVALAISMWGLWKAIVMIAKENSVGKTKIKEQNKLIADLRLEIDALKLQCRDFEELKDDFEYLEEKFDKLRDKILDKISL